MGTEAGNGKEEAKTTGLEGTGLPLPQSSCGSVRRAGSDPQLKKMLDSVKSSKSPAMVNYGASWCRVCSQIHPHFCRFSNEFKNLSSTHMLMNAPKQLRTYDTLRPSIFTGMEKRWMR